MPTKELPKRQQRLVEAWAELHQQGLMPDWNCLRSGRTTKGSKLRITASCHEREVLEKPPPRILCYLFQRAGFFKKVRGARDDY